jgi:hypothetical protein
VVDDDYYDADDADDADDDCRKVDKLFCLIGAPARVKLDCGHMTTATATANTNTTTPPEKIRQ